MKTRLLNAPACMSLARRREWLRRHNPPWGDPRKPTTQAVVKVEGVDVRSPAFLKTRAWRTLRYRALREGGARCECCGASPRNGIRLNVDHIQPRKLRPDLALDPYNLQILCDDCNAGKGNTDQTDWR